MKLSSLLKELRSHQQKWASYDVYVVRLAENSNESPDANYDEFPVFEIDVETEGKELTFLTNRLATEPKTEKEPLKLSALVARLSEIEAECSEYDLFSGSAIVELGEEYYGRHDVPICASGWDDEAKRFALLEQEKIGVQKSSKKWWQFWK